MDSDDLAQEIRIKCFQQIHKFNPNVSTNPKGFFSVCADNLLRDIQRKLVFKDNRPCLTCPFYDAKAFMTNQHDCTAFADKMQCDKWVKHDRYVKIKRNSNAPIDISSCDIPSTVTKAISNIDMQDYILEHVPSGVHYLYDKLKKNNFDANKLPLKEKEVLLHVLKKSLYGQEKI
jgi:hypothetical protein